MNLKSSSVPHIPHLVLIGGGHSHAIVLKQWGMNPLPGVNLTLITDVIKTPYSGMLPGHISGFYDYDQCHIDLCTLGNFAQSEVCVDSVIGLNLDQQQIICPTQPPIPFDFLSINIGSIPSTIEVPGASEYTIPVKPVPRFLTAWEQILTQKSQPSSLRLGIVGGGAGGVELALNMHRRLSQLNTQKPFEIHLFHNHPELLPTHNPQVRKLLQKHLIQRGIHLHLPEIVNRVEKVSDHPRSLSLQCQSGLAIECDHIFWVTHGSPPPWINKTGLATTSDGFIAVNEYLQSVSHPCVFAAGDIATQSQYPRPKAGVFAVRQGQPLWENLRRSVLGQPLKPYKPQQRFLSLIGTGDGRAVASWGPFALESQWLWWCKDHIDRKFMNQFDL